MDWLNTTILVIAVNNKWKKINDKPCKILTMEGLAKYGELYSPHIDTTRGQSRVLGRYLLGAGGLDEQSARTWFHSRHPSMASSLLVPLYRIATQTGS